MNKETISKDYANDMIFELQKAFWDERGKGARWRLTTLGRDYFKIKCLPKLQSTEIDDMVGRRCNSCRGRHFQDCGVTSSISPCEGDGPGANPGFLTISI